MVFVQLLSLVLLGALLSIQGRNKTRFPRVCGNGTVVMYYGCSGMCVFVVVLAEAGWVACLVGICGCSCVDAADMCLQEEYAGSWS